MSERGACPHCGSDDYGPMSEHVDVCLTCGYDTDSGAAGVCPGGKHPRDRGELCCDVCWARVPRNLPGQPTWRSRLRSARARTRGRAPATYSWREIEAIHKAIRVWLVENQVPHESPTGAG